MSVSLNDSKLGEIAYTAYCSARLWRSFNGERLPSFALQSPELASAWCAAAEAVRAECVDTLTDENAVEVDELQSRVSDLESEIEDLQHELNRAEARLP